MDVENNSAFVIPFIISKESAWKCVLKYLCEEETTPLESVCNSHIVSIDKEYYPIELLEVNWRAKWNAVSIFIERWTEPETHYERQVHYFDRLGMEHEYSGFDYFDTKSGKWKNGTFNPIASRVKGYSGDAGTKPWEPREVTVTVTEEIQYEKETGRKRTSGETSGRKIYSHLAEYPLPFSYSAEFSKLKKISYSDKAVHDGEVIGQAEPFSESEYKQHLSELQKDAQKACLRQIPGQDYADFNMNFNPVGAFQPQTWYCPVYHVVYTFKEQQYECFVSGYDESSVAGKTAPKDESLENAKQQYDEQLSQLKDEKKKYRLKFIWILLGVCAANIIVSSLLIDLGSESIFLQMIVAIGALVAAVYFCRENYKGIKVINKKIADTNEEKNNFVPTRQTKKKAILDIALNEDLNDSEKATKYAEILPNPQK